MSSRNNYQQDRYNELMAQVELSQTFNPNEEPLNRYTGWDKLEMGEIKDDHIYQIVVSSSKDIPPSSPISAFDENGIAKERINGEYFFDQETFNYLVDPKTGEFDATKAADILQLDPKNFENFRYSIACYDVNHNIAKSEGLIWRKYRLTTAWEATERGVVSGKRKRSLVRPDSFFSCYSLLPLHHHG